MAIARNRVADAVEIQLLALGESVVVSRVVEDERNYAEVDEVRAVYALDRLRDHGLDAKVHRAERGMLAAGALSVAFAGDDHVRNAFGLRGEASIVERRVARLGKED